MDVVDVRKKLSRKEKEVIIKEMLGNDYKISGENFSILSLVIDYAGKADDALTLAELLPAANTLFRSGSFLSIVSSGATIFSIAAFPVDSMIKVLNAYQSGHRMYSYRAIAYSLTAWAFNKPAPQPSLRILHNLRSGGLVRDKSIVKEYKAVWRKTSMSVIARLNANNFSGQSSEKAVKYILRAIANNNEQKLCLLILKGFENKFTYIEKPIWKSRYSINYPR